RLKPAQFRSDVGPETFRILGRSPGNRFVDFGAVNVSVSGKLRAGGKDALFFEKGFDIRLRHTLLLSKRIIGERATNPPPNKSLCLLWLSFTSCLRRSVRNSSQCSSATAPGRYLRGRLQSQDRPARKHHNRYILRDECRALWLPRTRVHPSSD